MNTLLRFLNDSYTAYQAIENVVSLLSQNGFSRLYETDDWELFEGGKYFVVRGDSSLIAFTVGSLDSYSFKIVASHTDSPALKLKDNSVNLSDKYLRMNAETYGGGIWYSFFDRPLKIAGRVVLEQNGKLVSENVVSDYSVCIPSVAVHMNRGVNDGFAVNPQIDLQPLCGLSSNGTNDLFQGLTDGKPVSYDLYAVSAQEPFLFGLSDEFIASPRIDNLTSVFSSVQALLEHADSAGICVAALFDNEEIGSRTAEGAGGDFLENTLRRITGALKFDDSEFYKSIASSVMISLDNAHGLHPNHPEKCDPTNRPTLGNGVVIKSHADKAYTTDALSSALIKTVFERAGVKYQTFYNRSDMRSGGTLGSISLGHVSLTCVDMGLAQLAMHSACECFAKSDFSQLLNGLTAFYSSDFAFNKDGVEIK